MSVKTDFKEVEKRLGVFVRRHIPKATENALNWTAYNAREKVSAATQQVFDKPTTFTIRSSIVIRAKMPTRPSAFVGLKSDIGKGGTTPSKYLHQSIFGGPRQKKPSERRMPAISGEFLVPSKYTKLNRFGNVQPGKVVKALANARIGLDQYQHTPRGQGRKTKYFLGRSTSGRAILFERYKDGTEGTGRRRKGSKFKGARWQRGIKPFMVQVRQPRYRRIYPYEKIIRATVRRDSVRLYEKALRREIRQALGSG
jgi:hypothetical protein